MEAQILQHHHIAIAKSKRRPARRLAGDLVYERHIATKQFRESGGNRSQ